LLVKGRKMPLYLFHLAFGHRTVPDEEGVELPNRSAAREEALAVVRDLADPDSGGNPRRWAGWFLQLADENGQFFRTPIGHPALEIVAADTHELHTDQPAVKPMRRTAPVAVGRGAGGKVRHTQVVRQMVAARQRTEELLRDNQRLRHELSSLCLVSDGIMVRTKNLVSLARAGGA
jgi:hypothetical protein